MVTATVSSTSLTVVQTETWAQLQARLRQIALVGDSQQHPYAQAEFSLREVTEADVWPVSRYILKDHLETQRYLHWAFQEELGIDTLGQEDEHIRVQFKLEGETADWALIPPIVEESAADGKPVLVDGEHRFFLAKELGVPIRVIWISRVPDQYPVVAKPIPWSEVKEFEAVPDLSRKRDYRYPTLASFPDISSFSQIKITPENYLYFFFRDLSSVCTSGVRRVGSR